MLSRLDTIVFRSQEHGLMIYFKKLSKRTFKQEATTEKRSISQDPNSLVAASGRLQEILIACVIYMLGVSFGTVIFVLELLRKKNLA